MSDLFLTDAEMATMKARCETVGDRLLNRLYAQVVVLMTRARFAELEPIAMRLHCPDCGELHVDEGAFATKPHHTHACQHCGAVWRPAVVHTVGVRFLPGFQNEAP